MSTYELRGNRVHPMQEVEVASIAVNFCNEFELNKRARKKCEKIFQQIEERSNFIINLSVKSDEEWEKSTKNLTRGHFDPNTFTITIPETTYDLACRGDRTSLFIIFHELGHLFLGHRAILHNSKIPPTKYFADYKMKHGNKNYLLLFGDKMYVYRTYYKDLIELNEFTKKHYKKAQKLIKKVELSGYFR